MALGMVAACVEPIENDKPNEEEVPGGEKPEEPPVPEFGIVLSEPSKVSFNNATISAKIYCPDLSLVESRSISFSFNENFPQEESYFVQPEWLDENGSFGGETGLIPTDTLIYYRASFVYEGETYETEVGSFKSATVQSKIRVLPPTDVKYYSATLNAEIDLEGAILHEY